MGLPEITFLALFSILGLAVCLFGFKRVFLEFRLIWFCEPVELLIRSSTIKRLRLGYKVEIEHEFSSPNGPVISSSVGPEGGFYTLYRSQAKKMTARLGEKAKGYFDPRLRQTYVTHRHYDLIDKIFSPLFLVVIPVMGLGSLILLLFTLLALWGREW